MTALAERMLADDGQARARFGAAFHGEVFLQSLCDAYPEFAASDPPDPLALYLSRPEFARLNANPLFDEAWYRRAHPDVAAGVAAGETPSGLYHYVVYGMEEGRFPNFHQHARARMRPTPLAAPDPSTFDAAAYLGANAEAALFVSAFPGIDALTYASTLGRYLDPPPSPIVTSQPVLSEEELVPLPLRLMRAEFDGDHYFETYLAREEDKANWVDPFRHYLQVGMRKGYSPNSRFSEAWYTAFYADVRQAVAAGELLCGFHHYVIAGRAEEREPQFDMAAALEAVIPGVTEPVLLERSRALAERLKPTPCRVVAGRPRTLWVVLPRLNPDISFGGYRAAFELIAAVRSWGAPRGLTVSILILEEERANLDYFLWRTSNARLRRAFEGLEVRARAEIGSLEIGPTDRFLAYSSWDVIFAQPLAQLTDEPRVISLVQEYEPIFHEYGSVRAISDWAFELPSYPIFNSAVLRDFFARSQVGVFKTLPLAQPGADYAVFEHVINRLPPQSASDMRAREERTLAVYARPEGHAARNLYELAELALKTVCARGAFDRRWRFVGLGALGPVAPVDLGGGHVLTFAPKMTEEAYTAFVRGLDIGMSLMYAPHPSVIPFEFATTGAMVITNTFSNRPAHWFTQFSPNMLGVEPTLPALTAALEEAISRVDDFEGRAAGALLPANADWPQVFDDRFLEETFGRLM